MSSGPQRPVNPSSWPAADVLLRSLSRLNLPAISRVVPSPPASWRTAFQWPAASASRLGININVLLGEPSVQRQTAKCGRQHSQSSSSDPSRSSSFDSCYSATTRPPRRPSFGWWAQHLTSDDDDDTSSYGKSDCYSPRKIMNQRWSD